MGVTELHCIVSGRVQLVMFRDFVTRKARRLKLVGFVQNKDDGTVEVVAQGPREHLDTLLTLVRRGPILARVSGVTHEWRNPTHCFDSFQLIR